MSEKKVELKEEQSDVGSGGSEENKLPKWKKVSIFSFTGESRAEEKRVAGSWK